MSETYLRVPDRPGETSVLASNRPIEIGTMVPVRAHRWSKIIREVSREEFQHLRQNNSGERRTVKLNDEGNLKMWEKASAELPDGMTHFYVCEKYTDLVGLSQI